MTRTRQIEVLLFTRTVTALRAAFPGETIDLCYEDDYAAAMQITPETSVEDALGDAFACDSCTLCIGSKWIWFIWGNGNWGLDAITDYTVSLEDALKPVMEWLDWMETEVEEWQ